MAIAVPPTDLTTAVGKDSSELPLQFTVVETYGQISYAAYHADTLSHNTYESLIGGVEQTTANFKEIEKQ